MQLWEMEPSSSVDSEFINVSTDTGVWTDRFNTMMVGNTEALNRLCRPGALRAPPMRGLGNRLMKQVIEGCLVYKPKGTYT